MKTILCVLCVLCGLTASAQPTIRNATAGTFDRTNAPSGGGGGSCSGSPVVTSQTTGSTRSDTQTLGISFVAQSAKTISCLGRIMLTGNTKTHTVAIYNSSGTVLTSASVSMAGGTVGQYVYASCTPFTLVIGTRYFIFSSEGTGDTYYDENTVGCDTTITGSGGTAWSSAFMSSGTPTVNSALKSYGFVNALWN